MFRAAKQNLQGCMPLFAKEALCLYSLFKFKIDARNICL